MRRSYQKELNEILAHVRAHEKSAIALGMEKHGPLFKKLDNLWIFYRYVADRRITEGAPLGIGILYAKISNCIVSIRHLLQQGYLGPAAMVTRSLFEATLDLGIILKEDSAARAKLFVEFGTIEQQFTFSNGAKTETDRELLRRSYESVKGKFHPFKPYSWCWQIVKSERKGKGGVPDNPSIKDLCAYLGRIDRYRFYSRFSTTIHSSPSYGAFISRDHEPGVLELGPNYTEMTALIGAFVLAVGTVTMHELLSYFRPEDLNQLGLCVRMITDQLLPEDPGFKKKSG